ncbi:hypothetical protein I4U23_028207 [Adineta vaga]|nr:hypothetical protein I4U23_028207 [Adineta vaga]
MATWYLNICRQRLRPARYHHVFGRQSEQTWAMICLQFLIGVFKCIIFYGLLYLVIKWYLWPIVIPHLMKYEFAQKTVNHTSILLGWLRSNSKLLSN